MYAAEAGGGGGGSKLNKLLNTLMRNILDWWDSENRTSLILYFFSHIAQGNAQDNYL